MIIHQQSKRTITITTAVMNRSDRVHKCVSSWIDRPEIDEYILVDWSSKLPLYEQSDLKHIISHPKLKLIRVEDEPYYLTSSLPYNLAWLNATSEIVLRVDIDIVLTDPTFFDYISGMDRYSFIQCGDHKWPELCGVCAIPLYGLHLVNGYNEYFRGWGYEDNDLYERLINKGFNQQIISDPNSMLYHIPHGNDLRAANLPAELQDKDFTCISNSKRLETGRLYGYRLISKHDNYTVVRRVKNDLDPVGVLT